MARRATFLPFEGGAGCGSFLAAFPLLVVLGN